MKRFMPNDILDRLNIALTDRYTFEHELGVGGMATVYLAHDVKHDRKVAVKVLRPELAAVLGAERFLAEIKVTANLQHPHILPLFDSGKAVGRYGGTAVGCWSVSRTVGRSDGCSSMLPESKSGKI